MVTVEKEKSVCTDNIQKDERESRKDLFKLIQRLHQSVDFGNVGVLSFHTPASNKRGDFVTHISSFSLL